MTKAPIGKSEAKRSRRSRQHRPLRGGRGPLRAWSTAVSSVRFLLLSVGPLHSDLEYTVSSQKEGYVLTAVEGTIGDFKAYALAGVSFEVTRLRNVVLLSHDGCPPNCT